MALAFGALSIGTSAWAQKPATLAELAAYSGADREQLLLAGAKAEGKVVWFTSFTGSSYKELPIALKPSTQASKSRSTAPPTKSCRQN